MSLLVTGVGRGKVGPSPYLTGVVLYDKIGTQFPSSLIYSG